MKRTASILSLFALLVTAQAEAQDRKTDSTGAAKALKTLTDICRNIDFTDPKVQELGTFYKAAPYIAYRGENKKRAWKDVADYKVAEEKKGVDEVCLRINRTVNQDTTYRITGYFTETESEGTWHVLDVSYTAKGKEKHLRFAFLKVKGRFILGDID